MSTSSLGVWGVCPSLSLPIRCLGLFWASLIFSVRLELTNPSSCSFLVVCEVILSGLKLLGQKHGCGADSGFPASDSAACFVGWRYPGPAWVLEKESVGGSLSSFYSECGGQFPTHWYLNPRRLQSITFVVFKKYKCNNFRFIKLQSSTESPCMLYVWPSFLLADCGAFVKTEKLALVCCY
jgi:hypothetical protein